MQVRHSRRSTAHSSEGTSIEAVSTSSRVLHQDTCPTIYGSLSRDSSGTIMGYFSNYVGIAISFKTEILVVMKSVELLM